MGDSSPFEFFFKKRPNYTNFQVFGCLCYPWLHPYTFHKLDPRSCPYVLFSYFIEHNVHRCFDPMSHNLFVSRHVAFMESKLPFQTLSLWEDRVTNTSLSNWSLLDQPTQFPISHTHTFYPSSPNLDPPHITHCPPNDLVHSDYTLSFHPNVGHLHKSS